MAQNYGSMEAYDSEENVANVVKRIANNLQVIRQITKDLGDLHFTLGGPHDSTAKRDKILQLQKRSKDLLMSTKSLFDTVSGMNVKDEASKLSVNRVKDDYNTVIRKYNEIHEKILSKMSQMRDEERHSIAVSEDLVGQLKTTESLVDFKSEEENLRKVEEIEKQLYIAQNLFGDIQRIVVENRPLVETIENNIINAEVNVDMANEQLLQAREQKKKATKKKIIIFIALIVILAIIGLVIWLSVRK